MKVKEFDGFVFGASTDLLKQPKYNVNDDGTIDTSFNNRAFIKKAYKEYLKGHSFFTYKGLKYIVPRIPYNNIEGSMKLEKFLTNEEE